MTESRRDFNERMRVGGYVDDAKNQIEQLGNVLLRDTRSGRVRLPEAQVKEAWDALQVAHTALEKLIASGEQPSAE